MAKLTPDQRNYLYGLEAERTGIHKPILAALYAVHTNPSLPDGETGLGISPANRLPLEQVSTFAGQVQYAANTIRSLTDSMLAEGLKGSDLWVAEEGRYSDKLLRTTARGYAPPAIDTTAARLEPADLEALTAAYMADLAIDSQAEHLAPSLAYLDQALLTLVDQIPNTAISLPHQREALLEALRIWRKLDTRQVAVNALMLQMPANVKSESLDETYLDRPLIQFAQQISRTYGGYPHQREALIRLTQLWHQLDSRETAIALLQTDTSPELGLGILDPVLIALVQQIPPLYQGKGEQRNALVECFRLWNQLDSRVSALTALGVNPATLSGNSTDPTAMRNAAAQLDRELIQFLRQIPIEYQEQELQREALLRLAQLWRGLPTQERVIKVLVEDLQRMQQARRDTSDAPPRPGVTLLPRRPDRWNPYNIQLFAPIVPDGHFTWAEATQVGRQMPQDQDTVDAIIRIARLVQQARDRIGRPFHVTRWYCQPFGHERGGSGANSRYTVGDAIEFYCAGLTGNQLYWAIEPWWPGGLGRYEAYPYLCYVDGRSYRARWVK